GRDGPALQQRAIQTIQQRAAPDADAARVLKLQGHLVALIEGRPPPLGIEIPPILSDRGAVETHARERTRIVRRRSQLVLDRRGHAVAQPAPYLKLSRVPRGAAV